jgi:hypothetical protein
LLRVIHFLLSLRCFHFRSHFEVFLDASFSVFTLSQVSKISLVDLAGSERQSSETLNQSQMDRLNEGSDLLCRLQCD